MASRSKYFASPDTDCIRFLARYDGAECGYVEVGQKPYVVRLPDGELVGTVNALCDAMPLILEHYEKEHLELRQREFEREKEAARSLQPYATGLEAGVTHPNARRSSGDSSRLLP